MVMTPQSCDTFIVMGNLTQGGHIIFGKNSDRPSGEVQEVIYQNGCSHPPGTKLKVTYIEIVQNSTTYNVILSKPAWMWGAEMGANEHGVCVGNEAIWSKVDAIEEKKLLGMDLVRLSLERSRTAREAVLTITNLIEKYGQGGPCSDSKSDLFYHNSYLIADKNEAWVLETIDKMWVAEKIMEGYRNISNCLTIGSNIDLMSNGLKDKAKELGLWDGSSKFDFRNVFCENIDNRDRLDCGEKLLKNKTKTGTFSVRNMFEVLRTGPIAREIDDPFSTTGSMVSNISNVSSGKPDCHWLTGTPHPQRSIYKPFIFTGNISTFNDTRSPDIAEERQDKPSSRSRKRIDRSHFLHRQHEAYLPHTATGAIMGTLHSLENKFVTDIESFMDEYKEEALSEVDGLFKDCVDAELNLYKAKR